MSHGTVLRLFGYVNDVVITFQEINFAICPKITSSCSWWVGIMSEMENTDPKTSLNTQN